MENPLDHYEHRAVEGVQAFFDRNHLPTSKDFDIRLDYDALRSIAFFRKVSMDMIGIVRDQIGDAIDTYVWFNEELLELTCAKRLLLIEISELEDNKKNSYQCLVEGSEFILENFIKIDIRAIKEDLEVARRALDIITADIQKKEVGYALYNYCDSEIIKELDLKNRVKDKIIIFGAQLGGMSNSEFSVENIKVFVDTARKYYLKITEEMEEKMKNRKDNNDNIDLTDLSF